MWVPLKKKKNKQKKAYGNETDIAKSVSEKRNIFIFSLLVSFSDLRKSDRRISSNKERKVLYVMRATRGYQKHRISPRIQVKIRKILNFLFFSNLRRSNGQNFRTKN